jgi:hypothetical protein
VTEIGKGAPKVGYVLKDLSHNCQISETSRYVLHALAHVPLNEADFFSLLGRSKDVLVATLLVVMTKESETKARDITASASFTILTQFAQET